MTDATTQDQDQVREAVRRRYSAAATRVAQDNAWAESALPVLDTDGCCSTSTSGCGCGSASADTSVITSNLYAIDEVADLPPAAVLASLGCGNLMSGNEMDRRAGGCAFHRDVDAGLFSRQLGVHQVPLRCVWHDDSDCELAISRQHRGGDKWASNASGGR